MTDQEKPGEGLKLLRAFIPDRIRVPFLRVSTRLKIRRIRIGSEAEIQWHLKARAPDVQEMESDPEEPDGDRMYYSKHAVLGVAAILWLRMAALTW